MNPATKKTEGQNSGELWLAPLRGVTIRAFRETFAPAIRKAGFDGAFAPFIPANPGIRVNDRLLADLQPGSSDLPLVPQVITKHPDAMRELLKGLKDRGFARVDLNAGCPFPMIVRRERGSGLFRTPDMLEKLVETGCEEMGPGGFSVKTRLGLERPNELLGLMPMLNRYPLAALTVHARTARQMYVGACDQAAFAAICAASANPVIYNGDIKAIKGFNGFMGLSGVNGLNGLSGFKGLKDLDGFSGLKGLDGFRGLKGLMVGRGFVRELGTRPDSAELLRDYIARSQTELSGDRPVLGRMKELLAYWAESSPRWHRLWSLVKICRSVEELLSIIR